MIRHVCSPGGWLCCIAYCCVAGSCRDCQLRNLGFLILKVKIPEIETFTKFEGFPNLLFLSGLCAYSKHIKQG